MWVHPCLGSDSSLIDWLTLRKSINRSGPRVFFCKSGTLISTLWKRSPYYRKDSAPQRLPGAQHMLGTPECPSFLPSSPSQSLPSAGPPLVSTIGSWGERQGWTWRSKTKAPAGPAGLLGGTTDLSSLPESLSAKHKPRL